MAEGAVAQVLEDVAVADERGQADPVHALRAHRRRGDEQLLLVAVLEVDHPVAADTAARHRPLGDDRRAVVGAAAAEGGRAGRQVEQGEAGPPGGSDRSGCGQVGQHPSQDVDESVRGQLAGGRDEGPAVAVALAADGCGPARLLQQGAHLLLDEGPLLLDHQDLVGGVGQGQHRRRHDRVGEGQLEDPDAGRGQVVGPDPAGLQRAEHVAVGAAGAHDAEPGVSLGPDRAVEPLGLDPCLRGPQPPVDPQLLEVGPQDRAGRLVLPRLAVDHQLRLDVGEPGRVGVDRTDAVGDGGDDADADPRPARPAEPEGVDGQVEQVLLVGGHEDRHRGVGQRGVGVVGEGRRLGRGVVSDEQHGAAVGPDAHQVGVLQHVAAAVEAGPLAVPGTDHAVDAVVGHRRAHLRPPHRRRGQLLVQPRLVDDPMLAEPSAEAAESQVEGAQRRARVARHERGRVEAAADVDGAPHEERLADRLHPREQASPPCVGPGGGRGRRVVRPVRRRGLRGAGAHRRLPRRGWWTARDRRVQNEGSLILGGCRGLSGGQGPPCATS